MPMKKDFTQEEMQPSGRTLRFIRLVAYTYRPILQKNGVVMPFCLN